MIWGLVVGGSRKHTLGSHIQLHIKFGSAPSPHTPLVLSYVTSHVLFQLGSKIGVKATIILETSFLLTSWYLEERLHGILPYFTF